MPEAPSLSIGKVEIGNPVVLAPMAGYTDMPFRRLCRKLGAGLICAEMVSSAALVRQHPKTRRMIYLDPAEKPVSLQLFGSDPVEMAEAAAFLDALPTPPDVIDINVGCPVPKITKSDAGSALLKNIPLLEQVVTATVRAAKRPVTVKMRAGWETVTAPEVARRIEGCGAAAVAVHARTRQQGFEGNADWSVIRQVKEAVSIPVIGNGDVRTPSDAVAMIRETGCNGVMIGRASVGNPWIFGQAAAAVLGHELPPEPTLRERLAILREHIESLDEFKGERTAVVEIRKHASSYVRGMPGASALRVALCQCSSKDEFLAVLGEFERRLSAGLAGPAVAFDSSPEILPEETCATV